MTLLAYNSAMSHVRIARLNKEADKVLEIHEGELVNEAGASVESPKLGSSIFIYVHNSRRKKKVPWTFRTAPIVEIALIDPGYWDVITNDGHIYSIDPDRVYH